MMVIIMSVPVQFLTVANCKILLFLNVTPCILVDLTSVSRESASSISYMKMP